MALEEPQIVRYSRQILLRDVVGEGPAVGAAAASVRRDEAGFLFASGDAGRPAREALAAIAVQALILSPSPCEAQELRPTRGVWLAPSGDLSPFDARCARCR